MIRGTRGLVRRRAGAGTTLRRGFRAGVAGTVMPLLIWTRPTDTLKLALGGFMLLMAVAASLERRPHEQGLRGTGMGEGS